MNYVGKIIRAFDTIRANRQYSDEDQFLEFFLVVLRDTINGDTLLPSSYRAALVTATGGMGSYWGAQGGPAVSRRIMSMLINPSAEDMQIQWGYDDNLIELQLYIANYMLSPLGGRTNPIDMSTPYLQIVVDAFKQGSGASGAGREDVSSFVEGTIFGTGSGATTSDTRLAMSNMMAQVDSDRRSGVLLNAFRTWQGQIDVFNEDDHNILIGGGVILNLHPDDATLLGSQVTEINPQFRSVRGYTVHRVNSALSGTTIPIPATMALDITMEKTSRNIKIPLRRDLNPGEPGYAEGSGYGLRGQQTTVMVDAASQGFGTKPGAPAITTPAVTEAFPGGMESSSFRMIRQAYGPNKGQYRMVGRTNLVQTPTQGVRSVSPLKTTGGGGGNRQAIGTLMEDQAMSYALMKIRQYMQTQGGGQFPNARSASGHVSPFVPPSAIPGVVGAAGFASNYMSQGSFANEQEARQALIAAGITTGNNSSMDLNSQQTRAFLAGQDKIMDLSTTHLERMYATMSSRSASRTIFPQIDFIMQTASTPLKQDFVKIMGLMGGNSRFADVLQNGSQADRERVLTRARAVLFPHNDGKVRRARPYTLTELNEQ